MNTIRKAMLPITVHEPENPFPNGCLVECDFPMRGKMYGIVLFEHSWCLYTINFMMEPQEQDVKVCHSGSLKRIKEIPQEFLAKVQEERECMQENLKRAKKAK